MANFVFGKEVVPVALQIVLSPVGSADEMANFVFGREVVPAAFQIVCWESR
jgi:hypothetical protein